MPVGTCSLLSPGRLHGVHLEHIQTNEDFCSNLAYRQIFAGRELTLFRIFYPYHITVMHSMLARLSLLHVFVWQILCPVEVKVGPGDAVVWFPGWEHETGITEGLSISLLLHFETTMSSLYVRTQVSLQTKSSFSFEICNSKAFCRHDWLIFLILITKYVVIIGHPGL